MLEKKFNKDIIKKIEKKLCEKINKIEYLTEGFLSKVYILYLENKEKKILRVIKKGIIAGFEYPGEIEKSLKISHLMFKNTEKINKIKSISIFEVENTRIQIMDYVEGKIINENDYLNNKTIKLISQKLANLHKNGKNITKNFNENEKKFLYQRSMREIFTNNETLFSVYENYYKNTNYGKFGWTIIMEILKYYNQFLNNVEIDRLTTIHGDFRAGNIIKSKNEIFFIDFSRIPYGEPAIDIGYFVGNMILKNIINPNSQITKNIKLFIDEYVKSTNDKNFFQYLHIPILRVFFINGSSLLQNFNKWEKKEFESIKKFISNLDKNIKSLS